MWKMVVGCLCVGLSVGASAATGGKFRTMEDAALSQAKQWQETGKAKPIMGDSGKVLFPFGQYMPKLTCAPLRACSIELQQGETVLDVAAGDTQRWKLGRASSGQGENVSTHIIAKPTDVNLKTNLIITTNRRVYHIELFAGNSTDDYLNWIGFYYPEEMVQSWGEVARVNEKAIEKALKEKESLVVAEMPNVDVSKLDFKYEISGSEGARRFTPVRVFNDGVRVYLQMPEEMKSASAPALLLLDAKNKPELVNYRLKDNFYIVDKLFDKAMLIIGPEGSQEKVKIEWLVAKKRWWN